MANYNFYERTNYFRVTDREALGELFDGQAEIVESEKLPGYVALIGEPETSMMSRYDEEADEDVDVVPHLQAILHPEDAVIMKHIGYEKMRYLVGVSVVITQNNISQVDIEEIAMQDARSLLGNPEYQTQHDY